MYVQILGKKSCFCLVSLSGIVSDTVNKSIKVMLSFAGSPLLSVELGLEESWYLL